MSFAWPWVLIGLVAPLALAAAYIWQLRRRKRHAVRYSSMALLRAAAPRKSLWKRHLPVALVAAALTSLALAGARPQLHATVPVSSSAVILALDVSGSMCSTDVQPNRLTAAQNAVRTFVSHQDQHTEIGLVLFSGFAELTVAPTTDRQSVIDAINSATTGRGTTIGAAILTSINAISAIDPQVTPAGTEPAAGSGDGGPDATTPTGSTTPSAPGASAAPGPGRAARSYAPEIVVLLTDGANTRGVTPQEAAKQAAARGVRVYPIGFGTTNPAPLECTSAQLGGDLFGGFGGGGGGGFRGGGFGGALVADDDALRQVASTTGGTFFAAQDAHQLQSVLNDLPRHVQVVHRDVEASVALAGLAVLLMLGAVLAAARWTVFPT